LQSSDKTATVNSNLNVLFQKGQKKNLSVVLIFVHGGIGIVANKETYNLMGRNFAARSLPLYRIIL
jgi:hypothetical protein